MVDTVESVSADQKYFTERKNKKFVWSSYGFKIENTLSVFEVPHTNFSDHHDFFLIS